MADFTIAEIHKDLENLLRQAGFSVILRDSEMGRVQSEQTDRVQVLWSGIADDRRIAFQVQIIVAARHAMGDLFLKCWETIRKSPDFSAQLDGVISYNENPTGSNKPADFFTMTVLASHVVPVLQAQNGQSEPQEARSDEQTLFDHTGSARTDEALETAP